MERTNHKKIICAITAENLGKKRVENSLLIDNNSPDFFNLVGLLTLLTLEVIPKLYHNAYILYVFKAFFFKSQANLLYLI